MIRIHQVLATLGYGDAIGHEVLGIQRVLRSAGYESEIFVETADHRLEPKTRDFRELVDFSHPDNLLLHHFSLGSKASRTAFMAPLLAAKPPMKATFPVISLPLAMVPLKLRMTALQRPFSTSGG